MTGAARPDNAGILSPGPGDPRSTDTDTSLPPLGFWARRSGWRRASLLLTVFAGVITAMMLVLGVGMWRNDMVINAQPVRTTATVLTVSALSTGVEFVDNQGVSQRPPSGVLYPGGLTVGQQFLVEYAASDPSLVRVAGRSAVNGIIMPAFVVLGTWAVAAPLLWWLSRRDRRAPRALIAAMAGVALPSPVRLGDGARESSAGRTRSVFRRSGR